MKRKLKRIIATFMALIMCLCTYRVPVYAEVQDDIKSSWDGITTEKSYEADGYKVTFILQSYWDSGYNASIKIENKSDSVMEHWYLSYEFANTITNIWNAEIYKEEAGKYIIKNVGWNSDIPVGGMVEFGFSGDEQFKGFPIEYDIWGDREEVNDGEYIIDYNVVNAWESGLEGKIKITNLTESALENWKLSFKYDNEIVGIWDGEIIVHEDNHYVIKNAGYNQCIDANSSISFGFIVIGGHVDNKVTDVVLDCFVDGNGAGEGDTEEPGSGEGNTEEPGSGEGDTEEPGSGEGNTEEPGSGEGNTEEPGSGEGDTEEPGSGEGDTEEPGSGDEGTEEPGLKDIIIQIDALPYDKKIGDFYDINGEFAGLTGSITQIQDVEKMYYEVIDISENKESVIEVGDINLEENWKTGKIGLGIGTNEIKIMAVSEQGKKYEQSVVLFNSYYDNLSDSIDMSDTDGDKLANYLELCFGTDKDKTDTDEDDLSDYDELLVFGTDPTKKDSDGDGIQDAYEDEDNDGLTIMEEMKANTNPLSMDTDCDGLGDGDEINEYFTNPLSKDTDNDGLEDGDEIKLSFNPNSADTNGDGISDVNQKVLQEVVVEIEDETNNEVTEISVQLECAGCIEKSVTISNMKGIDTYSSNVVGLVGVPVDIHSEVTFDEAIITFSYDVDALEDTKEEDLCILWYDEENHKYVLLEDSVVDTINHTVSYRTEHFSTYLLVDKEKWFATWRDAISYDGYNMADVNAPYTIFLTIDGTVSEEEYLLEIEVAKNIVNQMTESDRVYIAWYQTADGGLGGVISYEDNLEKSAALAVLDIFRDDFQTSGTYLGNFEIKLIVERYLKNRHKCSKRIVGFAINAGKNERAEDYKFLDEESGADITRLGFPVHSISVTEEKNKTLEAVLSEYGGKSYTATNSGEINRQNGFDTSNAALVDTDRDGLLDIFETNGILLSNGEIIYTNPLEPDSDFDGISDYDELGGVTKEDFIYSANEIYSCMVSNMVSNPLDKDCDNDGILDGADPDPLSHFGEFIIGGVNSVRFQVTDTIKVPYNSAIESAKQVPIEEYARIYEERCLFDFDSKMAENVYISNISKRVYLMLIAAGCVDGALHIAEMRTGKELDIDEGFYFLAFYMSQVGGYVEYNGTIPAKIDPNGNKVYRNYVEQILNLCERGTKNGETLTFTAIDSACFPVNYSPYGITNIVGLNFWLAVKGGHIGMTGKCSYTGTEYNLDLYYFIQDYYDFYYADPAGGKDSVGPVTNDEMAFLKYFGVAENFENCGIYHVNITWDRGQFLKDAIQKPLEVEYTQSGGREF